MREGGEGDIGTGGRHAFDVLREDGRKRCKHWLRTTGQPTVKFTVQALG